MVKKSVRNRMRTPPIIVDSPFVVKTKRMTPYKSCIKPQFHRLKAVGGRKKRSVSLKISQPSSIIPHRSSPRRYRKSPRKIFVRWRFPHRINAEENNEDINDSAQRSAKINQLMECSNSIDYELTEKFSRMLFSSTNS